MERSNISVAEANDNPFKWKHFSDEIILWAVRWYCQFALTYRDLIMMMAERGLSAYHTTVMRWVHQYAPELKKHLKSFKKNRMTPTGLMRPISR